MIAQKMRTMRLFLAIKPSEKLIIRTTVNLLQFNKDTCTDIQFTCFIFLIGRATYITPTALQFGAELLLRETILQT